MSTLTTNLRMARDILLQQKKSMAERIDAMMPRSGSGVQVRGSYPIYMVSTPKNSPLESEILPHDFQLKFELNGGGSTFSFTKGRVLAGGYVVVPTIDGVSIAAASKPAMATLSGGGQVFAKYSWTLDDDFTAPDWRDVFVSCELVQTSLGGAPPTNVFPSTGAVAGVSTTVGVSSTFLMAYDGLGHIMTYGQSLILPPDPYDLSLSDFVINVFPLVRYVA